MRGFLRIALAALCLVAVSAMAAAPSTFLPVVGGGVLCRDQTDHAYFRDYLAQAYKSSYKTEGEAYWYKPDNNQKLFGLELVDIFVSIDGSRYAFIGVVVKEKLEDVAKKLREEKGIRFDPYAGPDVLRSPEGAFLIRYNRTQSKLYCARHRIDPWRGEVKPPVIPQERLKLIPPAR